MEEPTITETNSGKIKVTFTVDIDQIEAVVMENVEE